MELTRKEIEEKVLAEVQEAYCMANSDSKLPLESKLNDLGFDSLDMVELVMGIEDTFDIDVPDDKSE